MWYKVRAQPSQSEAGQPARCWCLFQILLCQCVKEARCTGYPMPKVGVDMKLGCLATLAGRPAYQVGPPEPHFRPKH
jgi:hypothetical protein